MGDEAAATLTVAKIEDARHDMQETKTNEKRELSSVGSERLPYKQRVGGSTPSAPTTRKGKSKQSPEVRRLRDFLFYTGTENAAKTNGKIQYLRTSK